MFRIQGAAVSSPCEVMKWLSSSEQQAKEVLRKEQYAELVRRELAAVTIQAWWRKLQSRKLRKHARRVHFVDPFDFRLRLMRQRFLVANLYSANPVGKLQKVERPKRVGTARSNASSSSSNSSANWWSKLNNFSSNNSNNGSARRNERFGSASPRSYYSGQSNTSSTTISSIVALSYQAAVKAYLSPRYLTDSRSVNSRSDSSGANEFDDARSGRSKLTGLSRASFATKSIIAQPKPLGILAKGKPNKGGVNFAEDLHVTATARHKADTRVKRAA